MARKLQPHMFDSAPHVRRIEESHRAISHQGSNLSPCSFPLQPPQACQLNLVVWGELLRAAIFGPCGLGPSTGMIWDVPNETSIDRRQVRARNQLVEGKWPAVVILGDGDGCGSIPETFCECEESSWEFPLSIFAGDTIRVVDSSAHIDSSHAWIRTEH